MRKGAECMDNGVSRYHRFLEGDNSALEELVELYSDGLLLFIDGFVHNLAVSEDLTDETFFEVMSGKSRFKGRCAFKTWLFRIGRNNALDYLRRQARFPQLPIDTLENQLPDRESLERQVLRNEQIRQVHKALQQIHGEYREILHLLYFEDMRYADAALILRKNAKQIENLAYRARKALKSVLEKEGFVFEDLS